MNKIKSYKIVDFLWEAIKPYKWWYFLTLQAPLVHSFIPLLYNYSIKLLIDLFNKEGHVSMNSAFYPVALFVLANAISETSWRIHNFGAWRSIPYIMGNVMKRVNEYVFNHSYRFFQNNHTGSIVSKIKGINDGCQILHHAVEFRLSKPVLTTIFTGVGIALVSWEVLVLVLVFAIIQGSITVCFGVRLNYIEHNKEKSWHHVIGRISDNISNIFTIFSFASRKNELKNLSDYYNNVHMPLMMKWHRVDFIMSCIHAVIYILFIALLFVLIVYLKNIGEISLGDIAFTLSISYIFIENMWQSINAIKDFAHKVAAFKASFAIMQIPHDRLDKTNASEIKVKKGEIILNNISFKYENMGKEVLKNLSINIKAGEKVGLVGYSGAGKSTIISLLQKNFIVSDGNILIDQQSIYDCTSESLHKNIALIPQDTMLFHRSIGENIGYAKPEATEKEIRKAAKKAHIDEFIMDLQDGYNTLVGERGVKLSGGQRQRIAIARAFLKDAPILILDEATSSLDSNTEKLVQQSLADLISDKSTTVIAIAHRLSTLEHMDRIIVLDSGKIIEDGNHEKLLNKRGYYHKMWEMQMGGFLSENVEKE